MAKTMIKCTKYVTSLVQYPLPTTTGELWGRSYRRTSPNFPIFFSRNFLYFHILHIYFSNHWNATPFIYIFDDSFPNCGNVSCFSCFSCFSSIKKWRFFFGSCSTRTANEKKV